MVQKALYMINLASPDIRAGDIKKITTVLKSGNLVQGKNVAVFEKDLQHFTKLPYATVVSSGTAALHTAILALELPKNSGVIVPAFTFPATANVVENIGCHTILCDVDTKSYVVTPEIIEQTIRHNKNNNIRAIIVVHEFGYPAEMNKIAKIAKKYHLKLIEDAACALGSRANNHSVGFFGDMACFSFHPRKAITTGEGGAILTRSKIFDKKLKLLRNHGMDPSQNNDFVMAGLNYRMTDFQAVLGREQLKRFNNELRKRRRRVKTYFNSLKNQDKIILPALNAGHSWQSFMVVLDSNIDRSKFIEHLLKKGIQTNYGAQALNCLGYFRNKYQYQKNDFPNAIQLYRQGIVLPLYGKLSNRKIKYIARAVIKEISNA